MKPISCLALTWSVQLLACGEAATSSPGLDPQNADARTILLNHCTQTRAAYFAKQGQQLRGLVGDSFVVSGARIGCQSVDGLDTSAGNLVGTLAGRALSSADFKGSALRVLDARGVPGEVAVTQVETDPMDNSGGTSLFTLISLDATTGTLNNVCAPDAEGRAAAIALRGSWDASGAAHQDGSLSFYCTSGAIAKCVRWGYHPWQSIGGTSLASHHQACTRMARADYCGDGKTHTQEGTLIDMYDQIGVHSPSQVLSFLFEATWTPQGAYCIARERWLSLDGILSPSCKAQFAPSVQLNPIRALDLCLMYRIGTPASEALLSNRTGANVGM